MVRVVAILLILIGMTRSVACLAAEPAPLAPADREAVVRLLSTLEDEVRRKQLVADLGALVAVSRQPPEQQATRALLDNILLMRSGIAARLQSTIDILTKGPLLLNWASQWLDPDAWTKHVRQTLMGLMIVLAIAMAAEGMVAIILRPARRQLSDRQGLVSGLLLAIGRGAGVVAFMFAVYWAAPLVISADDTAGMGLALIDPGMLFALEMAGARLTAGILVILLRLLLRITDSAAEDRDVFKNAVARVVGIGMYGHLGVTGLVLAGLDESLVPMVREVVNIVMVTATIRLAIDHARVLDRLLAGYGGGNTDGETPARDWHLGVVILTIGLYTIWLLQPGMEAASYGMAVVATALILLTMAAAWSWSGRSLRRVLLGVANVTTARRRLLRLIHGGIGILVGASGTIFVLNAWGVPALAWLASPTGHNLLGQVILVAATLFIAGVMWQLLRVAGDQILARQGSGSSPAASRARTVVPMMRGAAQATLAGATILTLMSELGVDVTSLVAGASLLGLVAGLGSQTLVRDLVTGLFLLSEDAIHVGDEVELAGRTGMVEALSIRTLRLRQANGTLITIPFSAVSTIANVSRGQAVTVIDVRVMIEEDVERLLAVMTEVGEQMATDPNTTDLFMASPKVLGVEGFDAGSCVARVELYTSAKDRHRTRREFNSRLKAACNIAGIVGLFPATLLPSQSSGLVRPG